MSVIEQIQAKSSALGKLSKEAFAEIEKSSLPHRRWEEWRNTPFEKTIEEVLERSDKKFSSPIESPFSENKQLSLANLEKRPESVQLSSYIDPQQKGFLTNLTRATSAQQVGLRLENKEETNHLHIVHENIDEKWQGSELSVEIPEGNWVIFESFQACQNSINNFVTHYIVSKKAQLTHVKIQDEDFSTAHFHELHFTCAGIVTNFNYIRGAQLSRQELKAYLTEEQAEFATHALSFIDNKRQADHVTSIQHQKPNTFSTQKYKTLLNDQARSVFRGEVVVDKYCHGVDSTQLSKNILLSNKARIYTSPILKINNEDVKCAHGATVGQLDPEQAFYLQSRGFTHQRAYELLCSAYGNSSFSEITNDIIRTYLTNKFQKDLNG